MWKPCRRALLIAFCTAVLPGVVPAMTAQPIENTWQLCERAVHAAERRQAIPTHLLGAIAKAESGRWNAEKQANIAWPWTVTTGGKGYFFETRAEAVAEVEILRTQGVRNIDVGCMQINLHYHENAFETVTAAFDPAANAAYGASYLTAMRARTGNWVQAAGAYHSMTPAPSRRYRAKVLRLWNESRGLPAPPAELAEEEKPVTSQRQRASAIDFGRTEKLNATFRARRQSARAATKQGDRAQQFTTRREAQLNAWRGASDGGFSLAQLAKMRHAEMAQRRKRKYARFGDGDRDDLFAQRRQQQLNDWRLKRVIPFAKPAE